MLPPLPPDFIREMRRIFPDSIASPVLDALDTPSPVSVRYSSRKSPLRAPLTASEPVAWCRERGCYLAERPLFTLMPEMHGGAFYVQEAASMVHRLIMERIVTDSPVSVLDLCAAPGGKTTAMTDALPEGSAMVANELSPQRAAVLAENITKYGYPGVAVTCGDATEFGVMENSFDILAVDAPCSGEGMMRKEEVARTQWTPGLVESCARLQRGILESSLPALRPGGYLIYSTCTFNTRENEEVSRWLVETHGLLPHSPLTPEEMGGMGIIPALTLPDGTRGHGMRFLPGVSRSEGLYVAVFVKPGEAGTGTVRPAARPRKERMGRSTMPDTAACRKWIADPDDYEWSLNADTVRAVPTRLADLLTRLPERVKTLRAGVEVAHVKGRDLVPAPALALSTVLAAGAFPETELDEATALRYLRRESLVLPPDTPRGMVAVSYNGIRLGWVKNLGSRANNLWPAPWRIRMQ